MAIIVKASDLKFRYPRDVANRVGILTKSAAYSNGSRPGIPMKSATPWGVRRWVKN